MDMTEFLQNFEAALEDYVSLSASRYIQCVVCTLYCVVCIV